MVCEIFPDIVIIPQTKDISLQLLMLEPRIFYIDRGMHNGFLVWKKNIQHGKGKKQELLLDLITK